MRLLTFFLLFFSTAIFAQVDTQTRFNSDSRQYYVWNDASNSYLLQETEYEHSQIDIREIGSKSNGYIVIGLVDNGKSRLFHGSITGYSTSEKKEGTWQMRSKTMKGKLTYNPAENTFTYLYDANEKRYQRILIFTVNPQEEELPK
jgi:hypothetical protein